MQSSRRHSSRLLSRKSKSPRCCFACDDACSIPALPQAKRAKFSESSSSTDSEDYVLPPISPNPDSVEMQIPTPESPTRFAQNGMRVTGVLLMHRIQLDDPNQETAHESDCICRVCRPPPAPACRMRLVYDREPAAEELIQIAAPGWPEMLMTFRQFCLLNARPNGLLFPAQPDGTHDNPMVIS